MSDRDDLAEAIAEAMGRHGVQFVENGRDVCACGVDIGPHDGNDWDEQERHNAHLAAVLSATVRAFIGEQIAARYEAERLHLDGCFESGGGTLYGLDIAEQIARGIEQQ